MIPLRLEILFLLPGDQKSLPYQLQILPFLLCLLLLPGARQQMQRPPDLPGLSLQIFLLDLDHITVADVIMLLLIQPMDLAGQLRIFDPGYPPADLLDPGKNTLIFFLRHIMKPR